MRVLVTGGAGYVGSVSVETLLEADHHAVVLDDLSTGHRAAVPGRATFVEGSYADVELVTATLRDHRIDAILHCGARSVVFDSVRDPAAYFQANVVGGLALLDAAREAHVGRLVLSSTAAVYGAPASVPIPEEARLDPVNAYGETKRSLEGAIAAYVRAYGFRAVILRYFNAAGASRLNGEWHVPETHLIPNAFRALEEGGPRLKVYGDDYDTPDGTCVRDYVDVRDIAEAHLRALAATEDGDPRTARQRGAMARPLVVNLGSGGGHSVRQVLEAIELVAGRPVPHEVGRRRPGDPPALVASSEQAAEALGWVPVHAALDDIVGSAWTWRRDHPNGYAG